MNLPVSPSLFYLGLLAIFLLPSCSSSPKKGRQEIYVSPIRTESVSQIAEREVRTLPGEVMDPNARTFAQIPQRIIYLPGEEGIFTRRSPEQLAAYQLVRKEDIPEIQSTDKPTIILPQGRFPQSQENIAQEGAIMEMAIMSESGVVEGTARDLNLPERTQDQAARGKIYQGETLKFIEGTGWVGWMPKGQRTPPQVVEQGDIQEEEETVPPPLSEDEKPAPSQDNQVDPEEEELRALMEQISPAQKSNNNQKENKDEEQITLPPPLQ